MNFYGIAVHGVQESFFTQNRKKVINMHINMKGNWQGQDSICRLVSLKSNLLPFTHWPADRLLALPGPFHVENSTGTSEEAWHDKRPLELASFYENVSML